jgi:hypothetical protein
MDNQKQELIQKLKDATNILVTVSSNPSVDQLAACIGLTIFLNKQGKHATAVFSGQVPSTLEFLKPEDTLEKNTDSLRDFIVSLDKSKADKLRYKVENNVVKIFITPYKTSITEADLDFSQGDFNIDVVVCLGVEKQADLDQAITSHGRILHDATVAAVSIGTAGELGTLNWVEPQASSLSELAAQIADALGREQIDGQIATAFLTGIVAETNRFSNDKTSPTTMQLSAQLMSAGANQQLVASELQGTDTTLAINTPAPQGNPTDDAGTLEIGHDSGNNGDGPEALPPVQTGQPEPPHDNSGPGSSMPADGSSNGSDETTDQPPTDPPLVADAPASRLVLQPPSMGGQLTANSAPENFDPSVDPLTLLNRDAPMLNHDVEAADPAAEATADAKPTDTPAQAPEPAPEPVVPTDANVPLPEVKPVEDSSEAPAKEEEAPATEPPVELPEVTPPAPANDALPGFEALPSEPATDATAPAPAGPAPVDANDKSLAELEAAVDSPHLRATDGAPTEVTPPPLADDPSLDALRDAVADAAASGPQNSVLQPTQSVGSEGYLNVQDLPDVAGDPENIQPSTPQELTIPTADPTPPTSTSDTPSTAPPVPPPLPLDPTQFTEPKQ